jgi:hypothetical protein
MGAVGPARLVYPIGNLDNPRRDRDEKGPTKAVAEACGSRARRTGSINRGRTHNSGHNYKTFLEKRRLKRASAHVSSQSAQFA